MLKIGEFAGLTGLSVKALRHYDEAGVLAPADVDDRSGYRLYSEGQVRIGVMIRALRDADVPLPAVSAAVTGGNADEALERHRAHVLEEREQEDRAFRDAAVVLRALATPITVTERSMPAQPYIAQAISFPPDQPDAVSDEDANEVFSALFARLQEAGLRPSGPFWTAMRARDRGSVDVLCCWSTPTAAPESVLDSASFADVLPARRELVATWRPVGGEEIPEGVLHPAVVGLFDAISDRESELSTFEVRQAVIEQSPDDFAIELSVTVT